MSPKIKWSLIGGIVFVSALSAAIWCRLPYEVQRLVDTGVASLTGQQSSGSLIGSMKPSILIIMVFIGAVFLLDICRYWFGAKLGKFESGSFRYDFILKLFSLPIPCKIDTADVCQRVVVDGERISKWWESNWPNLVFNFILLLGSMVALLLYSPMLSVMTIVLFVFGGWFQKKQASWMDKKLNLYHEASASLSRNTEVVNAGRITWLCQDIDYVMGRTKDRILSTGKVREKVSILSAICFEGGMVGRLFIQCFLLVSAIVLLNKNFTVGKFVALSEYFGMIAGATAAIWSTFPDWQVVKNAKRRLKSQPVYSEGPKQPLAESFFNEVLRSTGVVHLKGPNGIGKSTVLLHIIDKLIPSKKIAFVQQGNVLFDGNVHENIFLGTVNSNSGISVLKKYGLFDVYKLLIDRLQDTKKSGVLSGGERQLISILRGFAKEADFYIFDEPTAHLDVMTKQKVLQAIMLLGREKHIVVVEHGARDKKLNWARTGEYETFANRSDDDLFGSSLA